MSLNIESIIRLYHVAQMATPITQERLLAEGCLEAKRHLAMVSLTTDTWLQRIKLKEELEKLVSKPTTPKHEGEMKQILDRCKCGVFFTTNEHRDYYMKAEDWLVGQMQDQSDIDEIGTDVWNEMIKRDTVYTIQFYPDTPIRFYKIFHYDYDCLIAKAMEILTNRGESWRNRD